MFFAGTSPPLEFPPASLKQHLLPFPRQIPSPPFELTVHAQIHTVVRLQPSVCHLTMLLSPCFLGLLRLGRRRVAISHCSLRPPRPAQQILCRIAVTGRRLKTPTTTSALAIRLSLSFRMSQPRHSLPLPHAPNTRCLFMCRWPC